MAKQETNVSNLKINRGTYANIQSNLSQIGENELIIVTDKAVPIPTSADSGKVIGVNASGEYELSTPSSGGMTNPMTTAGDIIYGGTSGTPTRLAKGTSGKVLTMGSSYPQWSDAPKELPTTLGTAGQVLTINSGATGVEWANASGGITEISTQYIRITDLAAGVYKLTYNGTKYIYYYGTSSTTTHTVTGGAGAVVLTVSKYSTTYWHWWYINGSTSYATLYYGYTYSSSGSTGSKSISSLYTGTPSNYYPSRSYTSGLQISSYSGSSVCQLYVPYATYNQYGVVKPAYSTSGTATLTTSSTSYSNSPTINARTTTAGKYYAVETDSAGRLFVNVPWESGGGTVTDVQVNGTSVLSSGVANIVTETAYNASSNKIATMSDLPSGEVDVTLNGTATSTTYTLSNIVVGDDTYKVPGFYKCTYGTTTWVQIDDAVKSGLIPYVIYNNHIAILQNDGHGGSGGSSSQFSFDCWISNSTRWRIDCNPGSSSWNYTAYTPGGCLIEGTKITMADGSLKNIEDIQEGDLVKSYNPLTKEMTEGVVIKHLQQGETTNFRYDAFSDGSYLVTAVGHSLLNMEENKERPMDLDKFTPGDKCLNDKGEIIEFLGQIGHNRPRANKRYYDILVSSHTYFANGICNAFLPSWRNTLYLNAQAYDSVEKLPEELQSLFELGYAFQNSERYQDGDDFIQEMIRETLNKTREPIKRQKELLLKLADTDYKVIKAVESGTLPSPEDMEARQSYRDEINQIGEYCVSMYQKDCEIRHKYFNMLPEEELELYNEIGFIPELDEYDNNIHKEFIYVVNKEIEAINTYKQLFIK